ncbi:DgyrCDS10001 [Dimorphilus gyrociliatus]|uniref:DgyrCDS10001 n=1 Tax=Dimorphilus gyrociliatus TaxID=2664684 RepID=A0A7I8VYU5_9ANNE|nr:DgyrCDS10001 [Dimorphilus gyrociliatus]
MNLLSITSIFLAISTVPTWQKCSFPSYIRQKRKEGGWSGWTFETMYGNFSRHWIERKEVQATRPDELTFTLRSQSNSYCRRGDSCFKTTLLYKWECLDARPHHLFVIKEIRSNSITLVCARLRPLDGRNIIKVSSAEITYSTMKICNSDVDLSHHGWPWIAAPQRTWVPCPKLGGFLFHQFHNNANKPTCSYAWKTSRMESECVTTEGLLMFFPTPSCNPFSDHKEKFARFQCWGNWTHKKNSFVILGYDFDPAHYVLKLPRHLPTSENEIASATMYNRVNLKISSDGQWNGSTLQFQLTRSQSGTCIDENIGCDKVVARKKCHHRKYKSYCKKSCNLCHLAPSEEPECEIPEYLRGSWTWYESNFYDNVQIRRNEVIFRLFGKFVCKSINEEKRSFLLITTSRNGCLPRLICLNIKKLDYEVLLLKISHTTLDPDSSFERLCDFREDRQPIGSTIHSSGYKILLPENKGWFNNCGLDGSISANFNLAKGGVTCDGTLSDWNRRSCGSSDTLNTQTKSCSDYSKHNYYYKCEAFYKINSDQSYLITSYGRHEPYKYNCWVIDSIVHSAPYPTWIQAARMRDAQCSLSSARQLVDTTEVDITVQMHKDHREKVCEGPAPILPNTTRKNISTRDDSYQPPKRENGPTTYEESKEILNSSRVISLDIFHLLAVTIPVILLQYDR